MKLLNILLIGLFPILLFGQNQGKIVYQDLTELEIELPPERQQYADMIPKEFKSVMELYFNETESYYQQDETAAEEVENDPFAKRGRIFRMGGGGSSKYYFNTKENQALIAENMMNKDFLITSEIKKTEWKVSPDQAEIAGYVCMKAEAVIDSTNVIAWFTPQIPLSVGPEKYNGLPGAILKIETESNFKRGKGAKGKSFKTIVATSIEMKDFNDKIVVPKKGKKVSPEEFKAIRKEKMEEMRKMNRGGRGGRPGGGGPSRGGR